jgi:trimeric autotransporter adhesin
MKFRHDVTSALEIFFLSVGFVVAPQLVRPVQAQIPQQPLQYFSVAPCRIVDTRVINSSLLVNSTRSFRARGTDFSSQGGTTGSCNIPTSATSVFFNFTVTGAQASGYLAVFASSQFTFTTSPTSNSGITVLPFLPLSSTINYAPSSTVPSVANGIALPICNADPLICTTDFSVATTQGTTDLVVDVVGYYAPDNGNSNTAVGKNALSSTAGGSNTAIGDSALATNTTGSLNTASGRQALQINTTGTANTAIGSYALVSNSTGSGNTAVGSTALNLNKDGFDNTAVGSNALINSSGSSNIALGTLAGQNVSSGSNNILIGNRGADESNTIRIGTTGFQSSTYIAGISDVNVTGVPVVVTSTGQLGIAASSRRFKSDINNIGTLSDRLLKLRPVSFRYKQATEQGEHPLQFGLIAEEVAKVFPELVQYDKQGQPFTVYYHLLTPLLLSEVQRQQEKLVTQLQQNTLQQVEIARLRQQLTTLQAQQEQMLKAVSARLNALEQTVQTNGKAPQTPAAVLTALPGTSR